MNERDEQWYRRELDRVTIERDRARQERKEMRAIVRQQTAAYECLEAERDTARRHAATYAAHIEDLSGQIDELRAENRRLFGALQDLEAAYGQIAPEDWSALIEDVVLQLIYEHEEALDE